MAEWSANALQTVNSGATVIFTENPVPCGRGLIRHRDDTGNDVLSKAVCTIEKIKQIENGESGYSGHSIKDHMVARLEKMYDEAQTDHERQIINEWIRCIDIN